MSYEQATATAYDYTVRFYPRWFTWVQANLTAENSPSSSPQGVINRLAGPAGMGPEYKIVVAINDDTVYAQVFLDVSAAPMILTIPTYANSYSILQLDVYGNIFETALSNQPPHQATSYALCLAGYSGDVPAGTVRVDIPYPLTVMILRIDKYSSSGIDQTAAANAFRASLLLQTLEQFASHATGIEGGQTFIAPLFNYAPSVKLMADTGIAFAPEAFLATLQEAMASPTTAPITADDRRLIDAFNGYFDAARNEVSRDSKLLAAIIHGAQLAHAALINRWQSHRGATNWIHFSNIGHWGDQYLDRAALTEYIQYGNDAKAAFYANAFVDASGLPLDGANFAYTITFPADNLPQASRFWSVTAYTPGAIELVPNPLDRYVVASYSHLAAAEDGSITILVQAEQPRNEKDLAAWLPVPAGSFSLLLRIYGPQGSAADGTYLPPKIHRTWPR